MVIRNAKVNVGNLRIQGHVKDRVERMLLNYLNTVD